MRAFIYCRVSTKEQSTKDHYSLENQEQRCRDYLAMKRWRLHQLRKDVASGKNSERDGFQDLLAAVRGGKVDVVIVYRLGRLSRNVRDIYDFLDSIKSFDVAFVSVTEGFDTTTAMGRAMLGVAAVFAQLTREMISENTKDGLLRRAESGLFLGNGTMLYGYDYSRELGYHLINPAEAEQVRRIFEWFAGNKWGLEKIARLLNVQRVPSKTGKQWSTNVIAKMLRNPVYAGKVQAGEKVVEGRQEAIITPEQFHQAQDLIKSRADLAPRSHHSRHLLSGLARCAQCGRNLRIHHITQQRKKGSAVTYLFYRHPAVVKVGESECATFDKGATLLESAVVAKIREVAQSGQMQKLALQEVQGRVGAQQTPLKARQEKLSLELAGLSDAFSRWADRLDSGKIDEEQFEQQNQKLLLRKKELQKLLASLDEQWCQNDAVEVKLAEVKQVLEDFPKVWDALEHEERQEMLRLVIESLKVTKDKAELKLLFMEPMEIDLSPTRRRTAEEQRN